MRTNGGGRRGSGSAARGAMAGVLGSSAMAMALRVENALVPRRDRMDPPWVRLTEAVLDRCDVELSPGATDALGALLHASYGALSGAAYALIDRRVFPRHP